ncbi:MAG: hypothetical protein ABL921_03115 [Pirellula sp.]
MENKIDDIGEDTTLDVMLYVLNDPALDRDSFELKLADNPELCEQVAQGVALLAGVRAHTAISHPTISSVVPRPLHPVDWRWIASLAASLTIVVGWSWISWTNRSQQVSYTSMVDAWSYFHRESQEPTDLISETSFQGVELAYAEIPTSSDGNEQEDDFPEWLIAATVANERAPSLEVVQ